MTGSEAFLAVMVLLAVCFLAAAFVAFSEDRP